MAIQLKKNSGGIILDKGLINAKLRVVWGNNMDIDIQAMVLQDGKATEDADFIYYYNLVHPSGAIKHSGDVKKGGEEFITLNLRELPEAKNEIILSASINNAASRGHHFGKATDAIIEFIDLDTNEIKAQYKPAQDLVGETCARLIKIYREGPLFKLDAVPEGISSLERIVLDSGLELQ